MLVTGMSEGVEGQGDDGDDGGSAYDSSGVVSYR